MRKLESYACTCNEPTGSKRRNTKDESKLNAPTFPRHFEEYARERKKLKIDKAKTYSRCCPLKDSGREQLDCLHSKMPWSEQAKG